MKRLEISLLMALIFCAAVSLFSINGQYAQVRSNVLRLHILANSDTLYDQELKLRVRDALQSQVDDIFIPCENISQAEAAARENIARLRCTAESTLREAGCGHSVSVSVEECWFPTRTYDGVTLPAGRYKALRVEIGEAKGRNWWCVMFPTMCASGSGPEELETVLTDGQLSLLRGNGYELRFRCVEWYERLVEYMRGIQEDTD